MPRLSPSLLLRAYRISPLLPLLLKTCRTLPLAINELRWMKEFCQEAYPESMRQQRLIRMCKKRSSGTPLQYLLGTQPFGNLEIMCRPGVLIPRPETESYTTHLARLLIIRQQASDRQCSKIVCQKLREQNDHSNSKPRLRILDLCTGTGCIPLLLHSLLETSFPNLEIHGIDISSHALSLARQNLPHLVEHGHLQPHAKDEVSFHYGDLLSEDWIQQQDSFYDVVISNPPYVSAKSYWTDTSRSVRHYEPILALVPEKALPEPILVAQRHEPRPAAVLQDAFNDSSSTLPEDVFYPEILKTGTAVHAKVVLMEVADLQQAIRVAIFAVSNDRWKSVEIWRDLPDQPSEADEQHAFMHLGKRVSIKGTGHGRSVVCWA